MFDRKVTNSITRFDIIVGFIMLHDSSELPEDSYAINNREG